jgi:glycosyltransferase involved in cell wall biosynthesis
MNILIVSTLVPFAHGGAEELAIHLSRNLQNVGHNAEVMRIPFVWTPYERLVDEIAIARSIRVPNVDLLIALKFPAYLIPHDNKVIWLLHQFRQAYDLFDAQQSHIPRTSRGDQIREMIKRADEMAFAEAKSLFAISNAAKRLTKYHNIIAPVLSAPLNDPELFLGGEPRGYIFAGGRIGAAKRQPLLIEALQHAPKARLVVAGSPSSPGAKEELEALAHRCGVSDRVTFEVRMLNRFEIASAVNHSIASAYVPIDEDSVGYVTLEAFQASRPVITTSDSGSVLEIVRHGDTGLVCDPTPQSLGAAMSRLYEEPGLSDAMGRRAKNVLVGLNLTWPDTIAKMLS